VSPLNNTSDLKGSSGILSTIPMNSMGAGQSVQQNQNPVIFKKDSNVDKELSMSAAHSNIARLVTKNEKGATGIADIVNKKFDEDITLSSALEKLESAQDYNEDMKAVVLESIEKASSNEDKIAVLEKGFAFLETEKKLSDLVQSGKMGLDEAKALLTKSLDFGCSKDFSLEKLNEFNEFSMNENDESAIQQKASEVFGTEVSTVNSPVNNDQSQPQSTNQLSKNQEVATKETNELPSKTIDKKQDNQAEPKGKFEKIITTPQEAKHSVENHETKEKINLLGDPELELFSKALNSSFQKSKIEIKQEKDGIYTINQDYHSYDTDELDDEERKIKEDNPKHSEDGVETKKTSDQIEEKSGQTLPESKNHLLASVQKDEELNQKTVDNKIKDKILTITTKNSYMLEKSSSKRRQMILNALPKSIDNNTLDSILKDERFSRGVKITLLLSNTLNYKQKLKVVNSAKNNEIVAYCQKHKNVFPQVRSALTPTSKIIQRKNQFISKDSPTNIFTNLKSFVDALLDKNGQFTIPDDIQAAKDFFNPSTFTTEERAKIVELLQGEKKKIGNAATDSKTIQELNNVNKEKQINRLKIDMMIAQFTEPWDVSISQQNKVYNILMNELIDSVEKNTQGKSNTLDKQQLEKMQTNIDTMTKISNTFIIESYDGNGPIDMAKLLCVVQPLPRLNLFAKDILKNIKAKNNDYLSKILKEMKQVRVDEQHAKKVVFIAKKCSDFIEPNKGKTEKDFFGKTIKEYETNLNNININVVSDLTKANASAVTQLAQALGYQESQ